MERNVRLYWNNDYVAVTLLIALPVPQYIRVYFIVIINTLPGTRNFPTLVPGSGRFQLSNLLGYS